MGCGVQGQLVRHRQKADCEAADTADFDDHSTRGELGLRQSATPRESWLSDVPAPAPIWSGELQGAAPQEAIMPR